MAVDRNRRGHGGPDLGGCTKNHCHGKRLRSESDEAPGGLACHQAAGRGTKHPGIGRCVNHGGATPTHEAAAKREILAQAVVTFGAPIDVDPATALLQLVQRHAGHVAWLGVQVSELPPEELAWTKVEESEGFAGNGPTSQTKYKAEPHPLVKLYQQACRDLAAVAKAAVDAGVAERVVKMYEQVGGEIVGVIERVLDRLDLTEAQRAAIPGVLVEELQALPGGAP